MNLYQDVPQLRLQVIDSTMEIEDIGNTGLYSEVSTPYDSTASMASINSHDQGIHIEKPIPTLKFDNAEKWHNSDIKGAAVAENPRFLTSHFRGPGPEPEYPGVDNRWGVFSLLRQTNTQLIISVILGVCLGIFLSQCNISDDVSKLVNLPGEIFLRVLKCFVIPMVFANLSTGAANIFALGKVSSIGSRTAFFFLLFSTIASCISLAISITLKSLHPPALYDSNPKRQAFLHVQCPNSLYMELQADESINCTAMESNSPLGEFEIIDLSGKILHDRPMNQVSGKEQLRDILYSVIPYNIIESLEKGMLLSVFMFAIVFGAAAMRVQDHNRSSHPSPLLELLNQCNRVFIRIISKIIEWSPIAVFSLVAGSLSEQRSISEALTHVEVLVISNFLAVVVFELIFCPLIYFILVRQNPFRYMMQMLPCATFAFGSASSIATLPITLRCVESTQEVSRGILHFVITIGSTVHMNGTAMLFPNAIVFLAATSSSHPELGWFQMFLIVVVSVLGSIGVAPVPNAGLLMIYTIWSTIYPTNDLPTSYSFLVAVYWYLDRMNSMCNVLGDTYVARIIAEQVDETVQTASL